MNYLYVFIRCALPSFYFGRIFNYLNNYKYTAFLITFNNLFRLVFTIHCNFNMQTHYIRILIITVRYLTYSKHIHRLSFWQKMRVTLNYFMSHDEKLHMLNYRTCWIEFHLFQLFESTVDCIYNISFKQNRKVFISSTFK